MCAQSGDPSCGCESGGGYRSTGTGGVEVCSQVRFVTAITSAAPLKAQVAGGYRVPGAQPGQMMTPMNGGNVALYQDIYGSVTGEDYYYYPGSWGTVHASGRP